LSDGDFDVSDHANTSLDLDSLVGMAADPLEDPRLTVVGLFLEAHSGLVAEFSAVHAAHGLTSTDFDTLMRLARSAQHRLRMSDLAAQTALSTSGITRIVDRLERRGLIRRDLSPTDRRSYWAALTDSGYDLLCADLPPLLDIIQRCFIDPLTPELSDALANALRAVRDAVRPAVPVRAQE
jgi:DNA-binding MarR family transcriptional regulator